MVINYYYEAAKDEKKIFPSSMKFLTCDVLKLWMCAVVDHKKFVKFFPRTQSKRFNTIIKNDSNNNPTVKPPAGEEVAAPPL